jgi:hypothetical protein
MMKLGRRGFFGIMGGAAAAGPSIAKGVAHGSFASPMPVAGNAMGAVGDTDWRAKRISELQAIISGNDPQAVRERKMAHLYSAEKREEYRLDSLRSVSMTARHRMFIEGEPARRERVRRADAEFDLADWLAGKFG